MSGTLSALIGTMNEAFTFFPLIVIALVLGLFFLMTPFSNVLNVITIPLGYEFSSCPNCPEFTIEKITYHECAECGDEHGRGVSGTAAYRDGERYLFCSNDCLDGWDGPNTEAVHE